MLKVEEETSITEDDINSLLICGSISECCGTHLNSVTRTEIKEGMHFCKSQKRLFVARQALYFHIRIIKKQLKPYSQSGPSTSL